jgi:hypothetical protein
MRRLLLILVGLFAVAATATAAVVGVSVSGDNLTCNGSPCPSSLSVADGSAVTIKAIANATTTTSTTTTTPPITGGAWTPPQHLAWYWQIGGGTFPAMTGSGKAAQADAWDIDGFDNAASVVSQLHAAGHHVICYLDVGTAENFRSDYASFPVKDLGRTNGWPGEKWLNVTDLAGLEPMMDARITMCQSKGFDAVEPDNEDGWENSTGFTISGSQQQAYNSWVASDIHAHGMAAFGKNDPEQASQSVSYNDGQIEEQDVQYGDDVTPYLKAGKPVLDAEYKAERCATNGQMQAQFNLNLDGGTFVPCW